MKVSFISLGCAKNLVDSEYILGLLRQDKNIEVVDDLSISDAIFINTCGFINDAKQEAIDTAKTYTDEQITNALTIVEF